MSTIVPLLYNAYIYFSVKLGRDVGVTVGENVGDALGRRDGGVDGSKVVADVGILVGRDV